MNYNILIL